MSILISLLLMLWFALAVHRTLGWVWLWQLKEYRLDRFFAEFSGWRLLAMLFGWLEAPKGFLWLAVAFVPSGVQTFLRAALVVYGLEALAAAWRTRRRGLGLPVFTAKAALLASGSAASAVFLVFISHQPPAPLLGPVLVVDLFLPFLIFLVVLALKAPTWFFRRLLLKRARRWRRGLAHLFVVGITGSYGKTSTKEFLATLLAKNFRVAKAPGRVNGEIALARFLLGGLKPAHEILIAELGAYKTGEIRRMARMIEPAMAIVTGINEQHVSLFGGVENIRAAKYELIEALPEKGLAIFNADSPGSRELAERCQRPKKLFSVREPADCYAADVRFEDGMLTFQVKAGEESRTFKTPLFGAHHVPNILAAATAALALGVSMDEIRERVQYLKAPEHTMQLFSDGAGRVVIDDTYSANRDGVLAALESLKNFGAVKKILVMPSLIELGQAQERVHVEIGRKIAEICELAILTSRAGFAAFERGVGSVEKTLCQSDPAAILRTLALETGPGDVILLESRIPEQVRTALCRGQ